MRVPLLDIRPQLEPLRDEILAAITQVVDSTNYILGVHVESLESNIASYCGVSRCIGVSSGTDALLVSLMAMGVGPGALVATTPYSFFATVGAILRLGAMPFFIDIDPATFNMDPTLLERSLDQDRATTKRIKAILPVHLFGQCADMGPLLKTAARWSIPVIEDAAQAIGAAYPLQGGDASLEWVRAGAMGDVGCFSFFPSKNLGGIGDGGMVTVRDDEGLADTIKILRNHGAETKYFHSRVGGNFRLDPVQAAVLNVKLRRLPGWHQSRRDNAARYNRLFGESGLVGQGSITPPQAVYEGLTEQHHVDHHIYNQYVVRARDRDALRRHLHDKEIGVEIYYPVPLHQQECMARYGIGGESMPQAEKAARETIALPIYPGITQEMQEYVVEQIAAFYKGG